MIKKCVYCGKRYIKDDSNGWGCCNECYYNNEVMLCRECGREITKFDFDDNKGFCCKCSDETDITICKECGRETYHNNNNERLCNKCMEVN